MLKGIIKNGVMGLGIGLSFYSIISFFYVDDKVKKLIITYIIMSLVFGAASSLFEDKLIEKFGLLRVTMVHFCILVSTYLCIATYNQWIPLRISSYVGSAFIFLLIYFVIWCLIYFYIDFSIKKINRQLKKDQ